MRFCEQEHRVAMKRSPRHPRSAAGQGVLDHPHHSPGEQIDPRARRDLPHSCKRGRAPVGTAARHSLRVRPYTTTDNQIDGAVMTLEDIDALKSSVSWSLPALRRALMQSEQETGA